MGIVYFDMSMSLDGRIAGPHVSVERPLGDGGERLHDWMFEGKSADEARAFEEEIFRPTGATVMGRRMFDLGVDPWGDNPTFHMPVYVVTHAAREPLVKEGGTTYFFVTDGLESALNQARTAAGDKDVSIAGGADIVQQSLNAGVVDEIRLHLVPVLLGDGTPLFDHLEFRQKWLTTLRVVEGDGVVHIRFRASD